MSDVLCLFLGVFLGFIGGAWLAAPGDGSLGNSCKPDGTCQGSLVCMVGEVASPRGGLHETHRCQLPTTGAK
jgi:hypothetical protein